jgi:hypothetical protein
MNLPGVPFQKFLFPILLTAFLSANPASSQVPTKTESGEQTTFGSEDEKFEHPVTLSTEARAALAGERSIADVLKDDGLTAETMPKDWFMASEVHLSSLDEADLVVMGDKIARGAYTTAFWVLRQSPTGYRVIFRANAQGLDLLKSRTNGLRDISMTIVNLHGEYSAQYGFDGNTYKIAKRKWQPTEEVHLGPTGDTTRKSITQMSGQNSDFVRAEAREWLWKQWQLRKPSFLEFSTKDDDGESQSCSYLIYLENGQWWVTVKIHQIIWDEAIWDQDSPLGPPHMVTEDRILIVNRVERTQPTTDDRHDPQLIEQERNLPASDYRLSFMEDGKFFVATL